MDDQCLFYAKLLSDEQLHSTQVEIMRKKSIAMRLGQGALVAQLDGMVSAIEFERQERMALERQRLSPNNPVVIETDQQLRAAEQTSDEPAPLRGAGGRTPRRPIRSSKPQI